MRGAAVVEEDVYLRVHFPPAEDGHAEYSDFHWFWLRHNCNCLAACRHALTQERVVDSSEISLDVRPKSVILHADAQEVAVVWLDGHSSTYTLPFLRENAYALNRVCVAPPPSDVALIEIDYQKYLDAYRGADGRLSGEGVRAYRRECGEKLTRHGAIVVRNRGLDTEDVIADFLPPGKEVISTHFGRIEDLRTDNTTNRNTDQLGYTNAPVNLHTDQPFIDNPPGLQILQCVTPATAGGENAVVDAVACAQYMRQFDPDAYEMLTTTPVRFHRKQKQFTSLHVSPILRTDETGKIVQVRFSYFSYAPHIVPFEKMEAWYRAYNKFTRMVRERAYEYFFALNSGDLVLYDNWRMFHARTTFEGPRHMRGIYLDSKDVYPYLNAQ